MVSERDIGCAGVLCLVGGWVDAVSFLRFGAFSGAMSGNSVLLGLSLFRGSAADLGYYAALIAAFLAAIIATRFALTRDLNRALPLFGSALLLAGAGFIAGRWSVLAMAVALGMQNAAVRQFAGVTLNSVFITGNLESLGEAVPRLRLPLARKRVLLIGFAWFCYALGAACGAGADALIRPVLAIPAALVVGIACLLMWPSGGGPRPATVRTDSRCR